VAEAEFEADVRTSLRKIYYRSSGEGMKAGPRPQKPADAKFLDGLADPDPFPDWLAAADLDYYVEQFKQSGFRGPLNRYRTSDLDFAQQEEIANRKIEQPAAFIAGQLDPVLSFIPGVDLVEVMRQHVADLRLVRIIDGVGHWVQQERPNEVNAALLSRPSRVSCVVADPQLVENGCSQGHRVAVQRFRRRRGRLQHDAS